MDAAVQFIAELKQVLDDLEPNLQSFDARSERLGGSIDLVWTRLRAASGRVREETWQLQYLAGVLGSDNPTVLAGWVARRLLSDLPLLILNCDWGHEWPLWAPGSEFYNADPQDVHLSPALASALRSFYDFWEEHYVFDAGWDADFNRDKAQLEAARLAGLLAAETEGRFEVENGFRHSSD